MFNIAWLTLPVGAALVASKLPERKVVGFGLLSAGVASVLATWFFMNDILVGFGLFMAGLSLANWLWLKRQPKATSTQTTTMGYVRAGTPLLIAVIVLRLYGVDYMHVPSSSMRPAMAAGDRWLVNTHAYSLRLPFSNHTYFRTGDVRRGDRVIFQFPGNENQVYVKRAIGLPGDLVEYRNKLLTVNGTPVAHEHIGPFQYTDEARGATTLSLYRESFEGTSYLTGEIAGTPVYSPEAVQLFGGRESCRYYPDGFTCRVPADRYFMMGDNRDNSADSRYWGFVSHAQLVGRAISLLYSGDGLSTKERMAL